MGHSRPDRKTIDSNIRFLSEDLGYGIEKEKGKPNKYRWVDRMFELDELETIADAIGTSGFIDSKTSGKLIAKLKDLTSVHKASMLDRELINSDRSRQHRSHCREKLNLLTSAIKTGRKIEFRLCEYDLNKKEVLSSDEFIEMIPYRLIWTANHYYIAGRTAGESDIRLFRISRITDLSIKDAADTNLPTEFNEDEYAVKVFNPTAETVSNVELCCRNNTIHDIIDTFGMDFDITRISDEQFIAKVYTDISPFFYAWVFRFGGDIRIIGPDDVVKGYADMLAKQR
jgi:predicted DNA-binding transcriptional regulator YafY